MEKLLIPSNILIDLDATESTTINKLTSNTKNVTKLSKDLRVLMSKTNNGTQQKYLLFKVIEREDITLYVLRYCFENYNEYDNFIKSGEAKNPDCYKNETEDEEVEAKFAELNGTETIKTTLPDSMRKFESERDFSNKTQSYIFEMEDWMTSTKGKEIHPIFDALQGIVIYHKEANYGNGWFYMDIKDMQDFKILFRYKENANNTHYYLFKLTDDIKNDISEIEKKNTYKGEFLLKSAVRGYPDWIMYDDYKSWSNIENDKKANLALSDEEVDVLNGVQYPLFINGLAGSGKSTILHYLFANAFASDKQEDREFLFLSYSKNLTEEAKRVIMALYCTNPHINKGKKIKTKTKEDKESLDKKFTKYFKTFQTFIADKFLDVDEKKIFSKAKHINYDKFQDFYRTKCNLPSKLQYSPIVVWSVIRTFIKGRKSNGYITSNDYTKIESKDRTVTPEDFKNIEEIYKKWYKKYWDTKEHWDDLDLIRYILNEKEIMPEFDIIFCDEAQDFTPIENRLILSMSKYSKYDLSDFKQIPIAYAGDPNQTISPTGFKWERLKDIFNKSFKEQIGDYMSLDVKTLNNNYRSKKSVVQFANSLQYIRKCFLSKDKLEPQCLWNPIGNVSPLFYDEDKIKDILIEGFNKSASIITGDDDEEAYKKDKDSLLLKVSNQEKVHTAITAKGLEADAVILYRFADKMPDSFSRIFEMKELVLESERYECMHFLTKLYIAVSRAKKVLYIIDRDKNFKRLWTFFIDNEFINKNLLPSGSKDSEVWNKKDENEDVPMGGISLGKRDEFIQKLAENYKPEEIAEEIFNKALINEDAREMKRAAGYFEEASNIARAKECMAYYHLFRQEYEEAGDLFSNPIVSKANKAADAYWEGKCWTKIAKSEDSIKRAAAQYYLKEKSLIDLLKIKDFAQNFDILSSTYNDIAHRISEDVERFENTNLYFNLTEFLEELSKRGFKFLRGSIAMLYYKNEEYQNAVTIWEDINLTASKSYYDAKEHLANDNDYNEKIFWMYKGGKFEEIIKNYSNISLTNKLNHESKRFVFISLLNKNEQFAYALNYPYEGRDKFDLLYDTNPLLFIDKYVLDDYDENKFIDYIETKIKKSNNSIFDTPLSLQFFKKIFDLGNDYTGKKPIWVNFLKLRDKNGTRVVLKNGKNIDYIFKILTDIIHKNNTIYTASCILEILFDIKYSYRLAFDYFKIILNIFNGVYYHISKGDFNMETSRNAYFNQCSIGNKKLNNIKKNLFEFATKTLNTKTDLEQSDIKVLYRIIEKTTNNDEISKLYKQGLCNNQYKNLYDYFNIRLAVNILHSGNPNAYLYFKNTLDVNKLTEENTIDTFDRDDSIAFIKNAVNAKEKVKKNDIIIIAELFYKDTRLNISDIKTNKQNDNADIVLDQLVSKEIDFIISFENADMYVLQLLYFTFEKIYANDSNTIAEKYDEVIKNNKLTNYPYVLNFIKSRALYRWQWISQGLAIAKKEEYKYIGKIENIEAYPTIKRTENDLSNDEYELITSSIVIKGILVVPNYKKKRVQFRKDTKDICEVEDGDIEVEDEDLAQQNAQTVTIGNDFVVTVVSEAIINIESQNKKYVVDFERMD